MAFVNEKEDDKMKVAVVTLPLHTNYGGILQAYALRKCLIDMGHESTVLDLHQFEFLSFGNVPPPFRSVLTSLHSSPY